jgi:hypothetical protein
MLRVPIRIGDGSAHIAASWSVVIVARRVVRAAETIPAASGHTKARVVIFCVVAFAIANLESGFVAVIVVVEAHLGGSGRLNWRPEEETAEKAESERSKR